MPKTICLDRIRQVLSDPEYVHTRLDENAWAWGLDYSKLPMVLGQHLFETTRAAIIHQTRLYYEESLHISFVHRDWGQRPLREVFDKIISLNEEDLGQIRLALKELQ